MSPINRLVEDAMGRAAVGKNMAEGQARRAGRALKRDPQQAAAAALGAAAKVATGVVVHVVDTAVSFAKGAAELGPWAFKKGKEGATSVGKVAAQARRTEVLPATWANDPTHRDRLTDALRETLREIETLRKTPAAVKINWTELGKHAGAALVVKGSKILLAAVVGKLTLGFGHPVLAHLLAPSSEGVVLNALGLNSPVSQLGLAAGGLWLAHDPFVNTLRESNLWEVNLQAKRQHARRNHLAKTLRHLRTAIIALDAANAADAPTQQQLRDIRRGLQRVQHAQAQRPIFAQAAAATQALLSEADKLSNMPVTAPARADIAALQQEQEAFFAKHTGARQSVAAEERIRDYFHRRHHDKLVAQRQLNKRVAGLADGLTADATAPEQLRLRGRVGKVQMKSNLLAIEAAMAHLMVQMRGAGNQLPEARARMFERYETLETQKKLTRAAYQGYKSVQKRSSAFVSPSEKAYPDAPAAINLGHGALWYVGAVTGLNWGVLTLSNAVAKQRLARAIRKASELS